MTEQEKARKAAELLVAWANGKKIQILSAQGWIDYTLKQQPTVSSNHLNEWRLKPEIVKQWYRVALFKCGMISKMKCCAFIANDGDTEFSFENNPDFLKWLTYRIEYELPND